VAGRTPPRVGWLFAHDWDAQAMHALAAAGVARFDTGGFDLFGFPDRLRLLGFDLERFARQQARRGRRLGWRGVLSHHEHLGALAAALVAEQLGLPGATPESILAAQHKLYARQVLAQAAPQANVAAELLPARWGDRIPEGLIYPRFVKPVKAAFSIAARHVDSHEALVRHTRLTAAERWMVRRLIEPFDRVCRHRLPQAGSAHRIMLETPVPLHTPQFNLDGWVRDGEVHALGVVDAIVRPGTQAFVRWELPSRLPPQAQARILEVARRFLAAIGYRHGTFNLEFFHDDATGRFTIIECNPRLASQFGDLYRRVLGVDPHAIAVALALGEDPAALPRTEPSAAVAASLVYRSFEGAPAPPAPDPARRAAFARAFPDALLLSFARGRRAQAIDYRWTGSHRYGIVHLGGRNRADLRERGERASALLGWPAPWPEG